MCSLIALLLFTGCNRQAKVSDATIHYSYCNFGFVAIPFEDGKYFLLDTGAEKSLVIKDRVRIRSFFRGFRLLNRQRLVPIRFVKFFQVGDLSIENFNFFYMESRYTPWEKDPSIVGVIGMDVLSQIYSYFDIKNQTITFLSEQKNNTELPSFVLSYENSTRALFNLCVNGFVVENVLFDTGFNRFLALLKTDKDVLNLQAEAEETMIQRIIGNPRPVYRKAPDSIKINNMMFDSPVIVYSRTHTPRLLGMEFVRQFSSFSIDPFQKKIKFFE